MINIDALNDDEKLAALESIHKSIEKSKEIQKKKITTNVELIVKALKKIESDFKQRYDETGKLIANLKNGEDGRDGKDGKDGKNGLNGRDGPMGPRGYDGLPGRNGIDGEDGVSITDAHIDFDGSLIISLSSGRVINVGEVVTPDIAEKIKVITNGGGTSQSVLDAIASLQAQISGITSGLDYQGTWNASTNTPALASGVGTNGYYYIVSVAGSTNLDGVTDWQIGDWAVFNGSVWQKLDQTDIVTSVAGRTGAVTLSNTDISGLGTMSTQNSSSVSISGGTISGITDLAIADGGTGASTDSGARTNLGATTIGGNLFTLTNPSAVRFPRFNADNTVSALDDASFRTAIGAGQGTVSSVAASVPSFLSVAGSPITSSGTLAITYSGTALPSANGGTGLTSFTADGVVYATSTSALETSASLKFQTANSALTIASTTTANGYIGFTNSADGGTQGYIGNSKALMDTGGIDDALAVRGENTLFFAIGSAEAMRLNSTGLGIGKSPSSALDVKGTIRLSGSTSGYVGLAPAAAAGSTTYTLPSADGTVGQALVTNGSGVLSFTDFTSGASGADTQVQYNSGGSFAGSANLTFDGTTLTANALTTTSTVTINGGTANGVGYLNASKVFTTGSALVFDGTNLLVGTTTSTYTNTGRSCIELNGSTDSLIAFKSGGTSSGYLFGGSATLSLYATGASSVLTFGTNATERARIDISGNLGLGVSPSAWASFYRGFDVSTYSAVYGATTNNAGLINNGYFNGTNWIYKNTAAASNAQQSGGVHAWFNAPSGVANSTSITSGRAYSVFALGSSTLGQWQAFFSGLSALPIVGQNITATATGTLLGGGTVSQAITFTQAMTLSAAGGLSIGTTSDAGAGNTLLALNKAHYLYTSSYGIGTGTGLEIFYDAGDVMRFISGGKSGTERMRLDSSGNLGLGVTPNTGWTTFRALQIGAGASVAGHLTTRSEAYLSSNWYYNSGNKFIGSGYAAQYAQSAGVHYWFTSSASGANAGDPVTFTTAMTLDADGDLGIGVTSPAVRLDLQPATYTFGTAQAEVIRIRNNASGGTTTSPTSVGAIVWGNGTTTQAVINSIIDNPSASSRSALTFSTNIAGTLTEVMRLDSSGNVGIGTTSPISKFAVSNGTTRVEIAPSSTSVTFQALNDARTTTSELLSAGSILTYWTGAAGSQAERMRLDASGNLGLGVTPSASWDTGYKAFQIGPQVSIASYNGVAQYGYFGVNWYGASTGDKYIGAGLATKYQQDSGIHKWFNAPNNTSGANASLTFTQAMTLDASGNLLVGKTSTSNYGNGSQIYPAGTIGLGHPSGTGSGAAYALFGYDGTGIGSITQNGTTATAYNTSSDYRLKNITGPITTSGAYIDSLNPVEGTWKADGSTFVGLIAHEVQEASRTKVATGTKDGAEMQAMDYSNSELIANLIAEVKSLRKRLADAGL